MVGEQEKRWYTPSYAGCLYSGFVLVYPRESLRIFHHRNGKRVIMSKRFTVYGRMNELEQAVAEKYVALWIVAEQKRK